MPSQHGLRRLRHDLLRLVCQEVIVDNLLAVSPQLPSCTIYACLPSPELAWPYHRKGCGCPVVIQQIHHLMIDNVVVTFIGTSPVWSMPQRRHDFSLSEISRDDIQRPVQNALL